MKNKEKPEDKSSGSNKHMSVEETRQYLIEMYKGSSVTVKPKPAETESSDHHYEIKFFSKAPKP